MAGEADFVADLGGVLLQPCIGRVGHHLAADEGLDAAFFEKRNLLAVAQVGIRFVFNNAFFPVDDDLVEAVQRIGLGGHGLAGFAGFVDFRDDRRCAFLAPAHGFVELLAVGGGQFDVEFVL